MWYLVRIETPEITLRGAAPPGFPLPLIGHSDRHACFTNHFGDSQDLILERLAEPGGDSYLADGGARPLAVREEVIHVRRRESETLQVRETRFGPVVSDLLLAREAEKEAEREAKRGEESGANGAESGGEEGGGAERTEEDLLAELLAERAVAGLVWPALAPGDTTADAAVGIALAPDFAAFRRAAALFTAPVQNLGYADAEGNTALFVVGELPKRTAPGGFLPLWADERRPPAAGGGSAASAPEAWPEGMIPFAERPHIVNPPAGLVSNANESTAPAGYPYFLGQDWLPPARGMRLRALLEARLPLTAEASREVQLDQVSLGAQRFLPRLLAAWDGAEPGPREAQALALLSGWDGAMEAGRNEPLLYALWTLHAERRLLATRLGEEDIARALGDGWNLPRLERLLAPGSQWCEEGGENGEAGNTSAADAAEGAGGDCNALLRGALGQALARRPDPLRQSWGEAHRAIMAHPILGFRFPFNPWRRELPGGGGEDTINLAWPETEGASLDYEVGASLRFAVDLANPEGSAFILNAGQSGHPASPFYDNLAEPWAEGRYVGLRAPSEKEALIFRLHPPGTEASGAEAGGE